MALALGCAAALPSLRAVETMTACLAPSWRRRSRIRRRISDTKLRDALMAIDPRQARRCIHRQVKAEHRRGRLAPTRLPFGVVAIDGKSLGKLPCWDHPEVQRHRPDDGRADYGLARVHRAHLVSSDATVCVDQRPIPGSSNEVGEVKTFARKLVRVERIVETDPQAVYALSMLRMVALNIVAALRTMARRSWAPGPPPWQQVVFLVHAMLVVRTNEVSAETELA
jgi:hypothetical protein